MKKYEIRFYFDGNGIAFVEAENEEQAKEAFNSGDFCDQNETEWGENYRIENIKELK